MLWSILALKQHMENTVLYIFKDLVGHMNAVVGHIWPAGLEVDKWCKTTENSRYSSISNVV